MSIEDEGRAQRKSSKILTPEEMQKFGAALKSVRKSKGLTLQQIEDRTGINTGNLSRMERGMGNPSAETLSELASALGTTRERLLEDISDSQVGAAATANFSTHSQEGASKQSIFARPILRATDYSETKDLPSGCAITLDRVEAIPFDHGRKARGKTWKFERGDTITFLSDCIKTLSCKPVDLGAHEITDDSMQSRFLAGDFVAIDTADTSIPATGGIFAVIIDGKNVSIRRLLYLPGGGMLITCDNSKVPQITLTADQVADISVVGRVKALRSSSATGF